MIKRFSPPVLASLALAAAALLCTPAFASHHFETAIVLKQTALNQLDNFVFQSSRPGYTAFVMTVNSAPKAGPGGVFAQDALYNIHVAKDAGIKAGYTFSLAFSADQFSVYELDEANGAVGAMGRKIGSVAIGNKEGASFDGIKVWAGAIKDPFYGNSPGLHVFRDQLEKGIFEPGVWKSVQGANIFNGRSAGAIVVEVPNSLLGTDVKVFMTTALKDAAGHWTQVQYSANPLFSHAMLYAMESLKTEHDRSRPGMDDDLRNIVAASATRASTLAKSQADPLAYGDKVARMLMPDVLSYKIGSKAEFSNTRRNGRALDDDAMSAMLTLLIGAPTDQAIANPKLYTAEFPYVMPVELK
ncbi:MAG TPA: hypothetical protein VGM81_12800 [Burkholderiaceae bacterium]|jgi:hypothetical protein